MKKKTRRRLGIKWSDILAAKARAFAMIREIGSDKPNPMSMRTKKLRARMTKGAEYSRHIRYRNPDGSEYLYHPTKGRIAPVKEVK
jgi:hypothetical protein